MNILILVGIVIVIVVIEKIVLVIGLSLIVNIWCVYIINFKNLINIVVNIIDE